MGHLMGKGIYFGKKTYDEILLSIQLVVYSFFEHIDPKIILKFRMCCYGAYAYSIAVTANQPSAEGLRIAMQVPQMPVAEPSRTPGLTSTNETYPAPTPTQSAYQENIITHFAAFLKDLFEVQPVYVAVSQVPNAVVTPIG